MVHVHLAIYALYKVSNQLVGKLWLKWIFRKTFELLTLSFYIRLILEAFLFINLSSISEIKNFNVSRPLRTFSLVFGFVIFILALMFLSSSLGLVLLSLKKIQYKILYY